MKEIVVVFTFLAFSVALVADQNAPSPSWTTRAKVLRVIDGDTLEVEIRRVVRVRMLDCWAPESRRDPRLDESRQQAEKAKGQAAKENLISLANGREVIVSVPMAADGDVSKMWTMGRVLGWVWLADHPEKSLSAQQVEAGHAVTTKPEELR
jgi:endonuclease YncB( thermonuclease family)